MFILRQKSFNESTLRYMDSYIERPDGCGGILVPIKYSRNGKTRSLNKSAGTRILPKVNTEDKEKTGYLLSRVRELLRKKDNGK